MSKLTKKLHKVCDAVDVKKQTTNRGIRMLEDALKWAKANKKAVIFAVIVAVLLLGNWLGL